MNKESLVLLFPLPSGSFAHWWHRCPWVLPSPSWRIPALSTCQSKEAPTKLIILVILYWILFKLEKILCCQAFVSTIINTGGLKSGRAFYTTWIHHISSVWMYCSPMTNIIRRVGNTRPSVQLPSANLSKSQNLDGKSVSHTWKSPATGQAVYGAEIQTWSNGKSWGYRIRRQLMKRREGISS